MHNIYFLNPKTILLVKKKLSQGYISSIHWVKFSLETLQLTFWNVQYELIYSLVFKGYFFKIKFQLALSFY